MIKTVSVIGLGYVGLPLAEAIATSGIKVVGIDTDIEKISRLRQGVSQIEDFPDSKLMELIQNQKLFVSLDFNMIKKSDVVIICVPTPLTDDNKPDLSYLEHAAVSIAKNITSGTLLILESTVAPMTTRNYIVPLIQSHSKVKISDLDIAYSPERIDPLNKKWDIFNTPKLVSGLTEKSKERAINFYRKFVESVIPCESLEVAESAKLLENTFRFINISFINEFSIFCNKLGVDVNAVINAASSKPYGFMSFYPGAGVGGHCIPVDPIYLKTAADLVEVPARFIDLADKVNREIPHYLVKRAEEKLLTLEGKNILVVGVAYKPNIADVRESPAQGLISLLRSKGAKVSWHDQHVKEWNNEYSTPLAKHYDLAILITAHDYLDLTLLGELPIIDARKSN